ncbi:unnamed protein product [Aureobasidium vineae]|uniref:Uncharacterized protein n=1 Tax=Aureobasidium vineae TaxID=2773715 RepID=A0A9N8J733_9PEZI|nr:unnamed protein product [Aureobasidium vineae]
MLPASQPIYIEDSASKPGTPIKSPPRKNSGRAEKQFAIPQDDEASAANDDETLASTDEWATKWAETLRKLHFCQMSDKYAAAMSTREGEWDVDRDLQFAMVTLFPWTKELISSSTRPTISWLKENAQWIDTKAPGVYACAAIKRDQEGRIITIVLKVGCAWSVDAGMKSRKAQHLDSRLSKECTFHQFVQSTLPSETLELRWYTLAMGKPFVRNTQEDEYLAARFYQLEAMLASSLGALHEKSADYKFRALQWWPFDDQSNEELPWAGGDSHCALRDSWSNRSNMLNEDEIAERKATYTFREGMRQREQYPFNIEHDNYLCTIDGCQRGLPG